MKILISGGLGFVGRHVSKYLIECGNQVSIVDNLTPGSGAIPIEKLNNDFSKILNEADFLNVDIRDCARDFFSKFDAVIHLAAIVGGRLTIENNPLAVAEDLEIDSKIIRYWEAGYFQHLTYLSSSAAYPVFLQKKSGRSLNETDINFGDQLALPDLTYGWAKLTGEYLIDIAKARKTLSATVIRPFSGYGPDQDDAYPFPSILKRVLSQENEKDFYVWGSGKQERDFVYIDDVAASISNFTLKRLNTTTNLCTGVGTSFINLAKLLLESRGYKGVNVIGKSNMPEGVMSRVGNPTHYFEQLSKVGLSRPLNIEQILKTKMHEWEKELVT
jgi:GDP-L-fucose synthase